MELLHTALWVADPEPIIQFYTETLGLVESREFVGPDGATNIFLVDDSDHELQLKVDEHRDQTPPQGIDHIAVGVDDVDATFQEILDRWDSEVVLEPTDGQVNDVRIAFVTDPEGYTVELIQTL